MLTVYFVVVNLCYFADLESRLKLVAGLVVVVLVERFFLAAHCYDVSDVHRTHLGNRIDRYINDNGI